MIEQEKTEQKKVYREQAIAHRKRLDTDLAGAEYIINVFFNHFEPSKDQVIAAYFPMKKEFDVRFLMDELVTRGYQCALPIVEKETRILQFAPWTPDSEMSEGAFGFMEPVSPTRLDPDFILAPLLAFDQQGNRLGQGGGYYDATLRYWRAQKEITFIGVGYAQQAVLFGLPVEAHDEKLDYVLTPKEVKGFRDKR